MIQAHYDDNSVHDRADNSSQPEKVLEFRIINLIYWGWEVEDINIIGFSEYLGEESNDSEYQQELDQQE